MLEEPSTIAAVANALDEERNRERHTLLADEDAGEALRAELSATPISLDDVGALVAAHATLVFPGTIEMGERGTDWAPPAIESFVFECRPVEHFNRQLGLFTEAMREWVANGEHVFIVSAAVSRTIDLLQAAQIDVGVRARGSVLVDHGSIESGYWMPSLRLRVLGDREIFGAPPKRVKMRAIKEGVPVTLADLRVGDYVVHAVHGIGQYLGLRAETILGATQDYLDLRYAGSDRMLVPVTQMHQIAKYSAAEGQSPRLSKMGGADWARTKTRVSESLAKVADELVKLYAEREMSRGFAFSPDTTWQAEMEEAFPYEPTPDQQKAFDATKSDMESARPMDRLICGDVGYGKTEVAMRAAFKAIADKKQVAVLVPTTLLADQHFRTFSARFGAFPVRVEELSRFTSKARSETDFARSRAREGRRRHRYAPAVAERRRVCRSRLDRHRRRAALRSHAQGTAQRIPRERGRLDALGDADSAHPAHVADGRPRSVADPDGAEEPDVDQDARRSGQRRRRAARDRRRARPRRPSLLLAQPSGIDLRRA